MADLYNTTDLDAATDAYDLFLALNNLSHGVLAGIILVILGVVLVSRFKDNDYFSNVMIAVAFIETIVAVGFWVLGFINIGVVIFPALFLMVAIVIKVWGN